MEFSHSGPVLYFWAWLTPKSSKFYECEQKHAVRCVHLKLWSWTRFLFTCMLEHGSSAPHSYHVQARMTCVQHDRAKKQGSAPTDPHLYTKTWVHTAGAEVEKRARWLLSSLRLKTTGIAVKRTPLCMNVFYTSVETLWTAANLNKWHTGFFSLCIGGLQTKSWHLATYRI